MLQRFPIPIVLTFMFVLTFVLVCLSFPTVPLFRPTGN